MFLLLIFPTNLPSREIRLIVLWFPEFPCPLQNALNNFYCVFHLHPFGTEVNLSTRLHTTVSSLVISYLSSLELLHDLVLMICHYSLYRLVLKPLLLTHHIETVPQICPSIKSSSGVETSQCSSAANIDIKNSFSICDKVLSSWSVLTPAGLVDSLAGFLLLKYLGEKRKKKKLCL